MFRRALPWLAVAISFVLAGGATATAAKLISGKQIRSKAIATRHLANSAVTVAKTHRSVFDEAVRRARSQIPAGPAGAPGPAGPSGQNSMFTVEGPTGFGCAWAADGNPCEVASSSVSCPAGSGVTGGGHYGDIAMTTANSQPSGNGWLVIIVNENEFDSAEVSAYAVCSSGAAPTAGTARSRELRDSRFEAVRASQRRLETRRR